MTSIGETLRRQRLQNKLSLDQISLETKISVRLLEAIESEQFEKLPGGVFRRSFVLQYARALGLDSEEIAGELKQLSQFDDDPAILVVPEPSVREEIGGLPFSLRPDLSGVGGSTLGSLIAAVGVMLACALIYSWWQTPSRTASPSKVDVSATQPAKQTLSAPVAVQTPLVAAPPAAFPVAAPPAAVPVATPPAPVQADGSPVRVGLSAGEKTWISISSDGKNIFSSLLEPHQTKLVVASEKVRLLIGNAGGLEISLNGKPIGPVGSRGQICVVELTPAGFQIVPRKYPPLPL